MKIQRKVNRYVGKGLKVTLSGGIKQGRGRKQVTYRIPKNKGS